MVSAVTRAVFAVFATLGSVISAGGQVSGSVDQVIQRASDGLTYVYINGTPTGSPACAGRTYFIIADENSEAGKKQFAMLLVAKATGQRVIVTGTGTCARWPDGENIELIQLID